MSKETDGIVEAILARRSIRQYTGTPIDDEKIERILEAGINAPSAHDSRPWHVGVVRSEERKTELIGVLHSSFESDMRRRGFAEETISRKLERSRGIYAGADTMFVLFGKGDIPRNELADSFEQERTMVVQSVAAAATQMWIAAESLGLSMCWFSAPLFCADAVLGFFGFGPEWKPLCLLTLGYPAAMPKPKRDVRVDEYVTFL